jgi:hypothetical protein
LTGGVDSIPAQFAITTVVGGTASMLGGGKFANGAAQAAFGYLFNSLSERLKIVGGTPSQQAQVRASVLAIDETAAGKALDAAISPGDITVRIQPVVPLNASATLQAPFVTTISPEFVEGLVCCYFNTNGG